MNSISPFSALGLGDELVENLAKIGFEKPTEIQERVIPELLSGNRDILGLAQTGTGKTASFALPLLQLLDQKDNQVQALVLTPTRELAKQITDEFIRLKGKTRLFVSPVYGGQPIYQQMRELARGCQVVVGTPGRVLDLLDRGTLRLDNLKYIVLDEADEMLNMGFIDDIETILSKAPSERRALLFSATMPPRLKPIVDRHMSDKLEINVLKKELTTNNTEQKYFLVHQNDKFDLLRRVIDAEKEFYGIVFCKTKAESDEVHQKLLTHGYPSEAIHGDIHQDAREKAIKRLKSSVSTILVATDVASRGVDIPALKQVINYSLPNNPESYVHRIGRTGRAGNTGVAISLVSPGEMRMIYQIQSVSKCKIERATMPTVDSILEVQKGKILDQLGLSLEILACDKRDLQASAQSLDLASKILSEIPAELALSALLHRNYGSQLSSDSYRVINEPAFHGRGRRPGRPGGGRSWGRGGQGGGGRGNYSRSSSGSGRRREGNYGKSSYRR